MSILQIKKLESGVFKHVDSIDGDFFLGRFSFKQEINKAFLVEAYGAKRREYLIGEIKVFDYLGTEETFLLWDDLFNRLTELGYTGLDLNPVIPTASFYISDDLDNALELGADNKLFVPVSESGGGSLIRQQFVFSGSQTFTLSSNYGQVYSVSVQGQGALKDTQYTLVAPNQFTILDTLDPGDYIHVLYSSSSVGVQPYYSQAETDGLLALKQNKFYSNKVTTPSSSVTGTTSETELVKITIPANTFSSNDILRIPTILLPKIGINAAATVRLKISTSATMPAGATGQIAQFTVNATSLYQQVNRAFYINGGNLKGFPFTTASNTDISTSTNAMSTVAFDTTVTQYLYVSGTLLSASDSLRVEGLQIMNN